MLSKPEDIPIRAAMRRISAQFPTCPEAELMLAIIHRAAQDLRHGGLKAGAVKYLRNAFHAKACGVSPAWIRETFEKVGLIPKLDKRTK